MKNFIKAKGYLKSVRVSLLSVYCLFALVSLCIYFNGLHNDFLHDDRFFIVQNLYLRSPAFLPQLLKMDIFHFSPSPSGYYRPIQMLSYGLDYFFWGLNPFGYHLTNVIIHSLNSFLVFLLVYLLFRSRLLGLLSGVLFCIHPIHIGVVTVIGGRSNILEMMFVFLALVSLVRYYIDKRNWEYLLSLLLFMLAVLSREGALLLPFFAVLCAAVLKVDKKRLALTILPFVVICVLYLLFRGHFMPNDKLKFHDILSWQRLSVFFYLVQSYVSQLILPFGLAARILPLKAALNMFLTPLSFAFILGAALSVVFKNKPAAFGFIFYLLGLLPLLNLVDNIYFFGKILSEPYVYMASVGFFIIAAAMLTRFYARLPKIAAPVTVLIILFYASLTVANNMNYRDEATFYKYLLNVDKNNTIAHLNLGNVYLTKKMFGQAEKEARIVLEIEPDAWDA
ncbi:MAG: hypothetical protein PHF11_06045, partial [Candidatus Omnitrophica bacterium]|nr:hypothetical protein [Candidatus Omnitrophota bacterium]